MPDVTYPLDLTGIAPSNLITDEIHVLTEINENTYRIIIPKFAPFYLDNFKVKHTDIGGVTRELIPDVDYTICLPYIDGSRSVGKMLYGGVTINTDLINGVIKIDYQTIGGEWTADSAYVLERLYELVYNPRTTVWDIVTNKPNQFPPTDHAQHMDTVFGHIHLIDAINNIANTVGGSPSTSSGYMSHVFATGNVHNMTKGDIGLGAVVNLGLATDQEVQNLSLIDKYVTLRQIIQYISSPALDLSVFNQHLVDTENPHGTNKGHIGLGNVENLPLADGNEVANKIPANKYVTLAHVLQILQEDEGSSVRSILTPTSFFILASK